MPGTIGQGHPLCCRLGHIVENQLGKTTNGPESAMGDQ